MDFNISLSNGHILRGYIKSPGENLRAVVILIHGLSDHIHRYQEWSDLFCGERIGFVGVDLPGHGHSDGKKGHIKSYAITDEMIDILVHECKMTFPGIPVFLYGQSMGGGIVLDYILRLNPKLKGVIVTSPWLKLSFEPDKLKLMLATIMKNIFPGFVQSAGMKPEYFTHDPEIVASYKNDPLAHGKISASLFYEATKAASNSLKNAADLKLPLLLIHGKDDMVCSPEGSREFAAETPFAELSILDGGYHELHNELFKKDVFNMIINWINKRLQK